MIKSLLVLSMLIIASTSYAEDERLHGNCRGMAVALELPDGVFKVIMESKMIKSIEMNGAQSDKHVELLVTDAIAFGYGQGYITGLLFSNGYDLAMQVFVKLCYNDDRALRNELLLSHPLK